MDDLIGLTLHDNYTIQNFVGKGGHGMVYRAYHDMTKEQVAIKVILPEHADNKNLLQRLRIEAEIIRDLRHPNIIKFVDSWEDARGVWMVMKWIGGGSLRQILDDYGALSTEQLVPLLISISSALDAAHAAQIVHRDIKPENILLDENDRPYLTDFGVAKRLGYQAITSMGVVLGTPKYLSPEQLLGADVSPRTDVYGLGITLFELLAGQHPLEHVASRMQMMMLLAEGKIPPVTSINPTLDNRFDALIQRATAKNPADRYPTASSLAWHFKEIAESP